MLTHLIYCTNKKEEIHKMHLVYLCNVRTPDLQKQFHSITLPQEHVVKQQVHIIELKNYAGQKYRKLKLNEVKLKEYIKLHTQSVKARTQCVSYG